MSDLKHLLNGNYNGLLHEITVDDCYGLKKLDFVPDVVFDVGCNVGCFTRYAKELFPLAKIVSLEPHKENIEAFKKYCPVDAILIEKAIGKGQLWHNLGANNGSGESYVSSGVGFYHEQMEAATTTEKSSVPTMMINELIYTYSREQDKFLIKIDIEGGEHVIFQDELSMKALATADYICMELHLYALTGGEMYETMAIELGKAIGKLMTTHTVKLDNVHLWARKHNF